MGDRELSRISTAGVWQLPFILTAVGIVACAALAFIPFLQMTQIIATTGANNPSNDYIVYTQLIDRILSGAYDWRNYFADTFIRSHCLAIPFLVRLAVIAWTHWNIYDELYIGIALGVLKVLLLFDAFTRQVRHTSRWLLLPILSALCFSTSQITDYGYGDAALPIGFGQLGLALGVWALVRFEGRWKGVALAALGGAIGTLSGGGGLPIWPALLLGLALLNVRQLTKYGFVMLAALLTAIPYLVSPSGHATAGSGSSFCNWNFWLESIAYPFGTSLLGGHLGDIGVILAVFGLVPLALGRQRAATAAPVMVLAYAILNIWIISVSRGLGTTGIAPWYAMHFMPFWLGVAGLAHALWTQGDFSGWRRITPRAQSVFRYWARGWALAAVILVGLAYFGTDRSFASQPFYLLSRAPVSASCLRNYGTAPTYCEGTLFQWGEGMPSNVAVLAKPLQHFHLSTLGPDEQWALQGDWGLNSVRPKNVAGVPLVHWVMGATETPYSDFHHLDLVVPGKDSVAWTVTLPARLRAASFDSTVRTAGDPVETTIRVLLDRGTRPVRLGAALTVPAGDSWHDVSIPLGAFAGRTITISLQGTSTGPSLVYRYPTIDVHMPPGTTVPAAPRMLHLTPHDYRFDLSRLGGQNMYSITKFGESLSLCAADYDYVYVRMAVERGTADANLFVYYFADRPSEPQRPPLFQIPLYADGRMHQYTLDLKLLDLPVGAQLTWMRFNPVYGTTPSALSHGTSVRFADVRLVRGPSRPACKLP